MNLSLWLYVERNESLGFASSQKPKKESGRNSQNRNWNTETKREQKLNNSQRDQTLKSITRGRVSKEMPDGTRFASPPWTKNGSLLTLALEKTGSNDICTLIFGPTRLTRVVKPSRHPNE